MTELSYGQRRGQGYDRYFGHVSREFVPPLIRAGRIAPGQRVLDIATGTGLVAEAAAVAVGPTGSVLAADIAPAMLEQAKERLAVLPNVSLAVEDGQALTFPDGSFDAVLCGLGLMFFPDPARGLSEFHRVLRPGGRVAVSVNTTAERSYNTRINLATARFVPALREAAERVFSLADGVRLASLLDAAGFSKVETFTEARTFACPSFDAYFEEVERGGGPTGQAYVALPEEQRRAVREEVRRDLGDTGGAIEVPVEILFGSGRK
jgi:ubiquinone/menaquinone biosynthesis C-methylase UbiE